MEAVVCRQQVVGDNTILSIEITDDNGTIYPFRTKLRGITNPSVKDLDDRKALLIQMVTDQLNEIQDEMIPKSEIDAVLVELEKAGKIDSKTWEELQEEAETAEVISK